MGFTEVLIICQKSFTDFLFSLKTLLDLFLADMKNGTMFSFDYGPFACAGKYFPLMETKDTTLWLFQKFKFTIDPGCAKYKSWVLVTMKLRPVRGVCATYI